MEMIYLDGRDKIDGIPENKLMAIAFNDEEFNVFILDLENWRESTLLRIIKPTKEHL